MPVSAQRRPHRSRMQSSQTFPQRIAVAGWCTNLALLCLCLLSACSRPHTTHKYFLKGDQSAEYLHQATRISHIEVEQPVDYRVDFAAEPRRLHREQKEEIWDLRLEEAIQLALANSKVIRNAGQYLNPGNPLLNNPDYVSSVYDPAIQETGFLFGQRGVEAALSDFDTQFTTQMLWGRNEAVQNNAFTSGGIAPGGTLVNETGAFNTSLQKRLGTGGQVALSHAWNYTGTNVPAALFPSVYEGNLRAEFRQPLLAGGGAGYTRIAGPISTNIQGVTGVQQGVIIARINNDIALADFERAVSQLVHDVEALYWQLHLAYRAYDVQVRTLGDVLDTWQYVDALKQARTGVGGVEIIVRDAELAYEGQVAQARNQIYTIEAQLRLLLSLPVNDGRIIRPIDDPITARLEPDWATCLIDALSNRAEIRRQKWNIKSLELQLLAAENLTLPRFDFLASYQHNGFGDHLLGGSRDGVSPGNNLGSAYGTLLGGDQTGWNLGFEFSMPLGRRFALAQQRSLELRLAKAKEMLSAQEVEISHEVAAAFRDIDNYYEATENALNRLLVSREKLQIARAQYQSDPERFSIEAVLRGQEAVGQAELQFLNSLVQYNSAINDLQFRTGRSLSANLIVLTEGGWDPAAQRDAFNNYHARFRAYESPVLVQHPELSGVMVLPPTLEEPQPLFEGPSEPHKPSWQPAVPPSPLPVGETPAEEAFLPPVALPSGSDS